MSDVLLDTREWEDFLKKLGSKLNNAARILQVLGNTIGFRDIVRHFESEQGPEGPWQPRKESTNRAYDVLGGNYRSSNKILQLTGKLKGSILPGQGKSEIVDRQTVRLFTPVVYGHRHDQGTFNMPKREFMWLSDKAKEDMMNALLEELTKD